MNVLFFIRNSVKVGTKIVFCSETRKILKEIWSHTCVMAMIANFGRKNSDSCTFIHSVCSMFATEKALNLF